MKKTLKIALFVIIAVLISGCMTPKRINRLKDRLCHDYSTVITKDSLVKIPVYYSDTAFMSMWLACDSNNQIYLLEKQTLQGTISTLFSQLKDNKVIVHSYTKIHDTVYTTVTKTVTKEGAVVYRALPLTQWQSFRLIGFWVLLCILLIGIVWRLLKKKIKSYLGFMDLVR